MTKQRKRYHALMEKLDPSTKLPLESEIRSYGHILFNPNSTLKERPETTKSNVKALKALFS